MIEEIKRSIFIIIRMIFVSFLPALERQSSEAHLLVTLEKEELHNVVYLNRQSGGELSAPLVQQEQSWQIPTGYNYF